MICAVCKTEVTGQTSTWDGEIVHLVCPGVDYLTLPTNAYHAHIFWNEAVPGGYYGYNPEIPWEEVERQAKTYRLAVRREELDGKVYIAVDDWL